MNTTFATTAKGGVHHIILSLEHMHASEDVIRTACNSAIQLHKSVLGELVEYEQYSSYSTARMRLLKTHPEIKLCTKCSQYFGLTSRVEQVLAVVEYNELHPGEIDPVVEFHQHVPVPTVNELLMLSEKLGLDYVDVFKQYLALTRLK